MKMTWKTLLAAGCALSMLFTMPGSAVLAEELQEDAVIVSEAAQIDSEEADLDTEISADIDENAPDSGTYDAIELPADAVEEVPEMNEPFPSAETDEAVTYEDEIAVDEIAIEENASLESEEIVGLAYLGGGMTLEREAGIGFGHTASIIDNLYRCTAGIHHEYLYGLGTCIDSILHEFLDNRGWALYHLTCRYLIGNTIWQKLNYIHCSLK